MTDPENEPATIAGQDSKPVLILHEELNTYWKDADPKSRLTWDEIRELAWKGRRSAALRPNPDAEHCAEQAAAATERGDKNAAALWIELANLHALLHATR